MLKSDAIRLIDTQERPFWTSLTRLAYELEEAWSVRGFAREAFPELASRALVKAKLAENFNENDVLEAVLTSQALPPQLDITASFGQPPLTTLRTAHFLVDIYFWTNLDVSIHDHSFVGAFANLSGDSFNCLYEFTGDTGSESDVVSGNLRLKAVDKLKSGDVRPIVDGRRFIHQVWHLDYPTVTVAIRTFGVDPERRPFTYLPPGLAWKNGIASSEIDQRRMQFLRYLFAAHRPNRLEFASRLINFSTPYQGLTALFLTDSLCSQEEWSELHSYLQNSDSSWIHAGLAAIASVETRKYIHWDKLVKRAHRELVAALLTCDSSRTLREFLDQAPSSKIVYILGELSDDKVLAFELTRPHLAAVEGLLAGIGEREILSSIQRRYPDVHASDHSIAGVCGSIRTLPLLRPLFSGSAS